MAENIVGKFLTGYVLIIIIANLLPLMLTAITGIDLTNVGGTDMSGFNTLFQIVVAIVALIYLLKHFGIIKHLSI